jgi:hypothetical protein
MVRRLKRNKEKYAAEESKGIQGDAKWVDAWKLFP